MALAVVFGLQLLRDLFPGLVFYLRESAGAGSFVAGGYALVVFLGAFLALLLVRLLGTRGSLAVSVAGIGIARLAEQFVPWPAVDLGLTTVGVLMFLWFVPLYTARLRGRGASGGQALAMGFLLGITVDTAIKGAFSTLDMSWQPGAASFLLMVFLAGAYALLAHRVLGEDAPAAEQAGGGLRWIPLAALGPILFLELLLFQNIGQQTVLTGWDQPLVFLWTMAGNVLGLFAAAAVLARRVPGSRVAVAGLACLFALVVVGEQSGITAALTAMFGSVALSMAAASIGASVGRVSGTHRAAPGSSAVLAVVTSGWGMVALLLMVFLYYANYGIALPGGAAAIPQVAAVSVLLFTAAALPVLGRDGPPTTSGALGLPVALAGLVLLLAPLGYWATWNEAKASGEAQFPLRVMTYNLHQGFNQDGYLGIGDLADVIETENVDIVALQEVSRGWVVNGAFDMLPWLSRRLDMPYVWVPAADSVWGTAVLSRHSISESSVHPMPNNSSIPMDRSYAVVVIPVVGSTPLTVLASHLHHVEDEGSLRAPQVTALLDAWDGRDSTVVLADLNIRPSDPEMVPLAESGLVDAFAVSPEYNGQGYPSPSRDLSQRVDYIWVSPDLRTTDFSISGGTASDHQAMAVTLDR